ncbi:MAG: SDR family oxidoreductase [Anaerolineales bacterium]|nr:SDR family oxidoreductase [Anaerolineales bacterium]
MNQEEKLNGKVCLVTGATSGIGEVTALELARRGGTVVVVSRSPRKCRETVNTIKQQTENEQVSYLAADLSSQEEIRQLAADFQSRHQRLDVLVNNAGSLFWERKESADGIEMTFALNHLNYFLLTNLLLDTLKASEPSRIINVSSGAHRGQKLNLDNLELKEDYSPMKAYGRSKLANLYFTYQLARRLTDGGVTINALHPGLVSTNFAREGKSWLRFIMPLVQVFAKSPQEGAETSVYLAASPRVEGVSGKYFQDKEMVSSSAVSYDQETAERLWEISAEMTGINP